MVHYLHNLSKSIQSCWIMPHISKILQNFWLTLIIIIINIGSGFHMIFKRWTSFFFNWNIIPSFSLKCLPIFLMSIKSTNLVSCIDFLNKSGVSIKNYRTWSHSSNLIRLILSFLKITGCMNNGAYISKFYPTIDMHILFFYFCSYAIDEIFSSVKYFIDEWTE